MGPDHRPSPARGRPAQAEPQAADERADVFVAALADKAELMVSVWADDEPAAERLESELRLRAHKRLREAGVFS